MYQLATNWWWLPFSFVWIALFFSTSFYFASVVNGITVTLFLVVKCPSAYEVCEHTGIISPMGIGWQWVVDRSQGFCEYPIVPKR